MAAAAFRAAPPAIIAVIVAALCAASAPLARTAEAAPAISLNPASGPAPSVTGTITGSGWECSPGVAPVGNAAVSGSGVNGSAFINRDGSLGGDFVVDGDPGDSIVITVKADVSCPTIGPPIYLQATATFTFDEPTPEPTATHTTAPTATHTPPAPSPTAPPAATATPTPPGPATPPPTIARPSPSATAVAGSPAAGTATPALSPTPGAPTPATGRRAVTYTGCVPAGDLTFEFTPLYLLGIEPPAATPSGPSIMVPAVQNGDGSLGFTPPLSEPMRVFKVEPPADEPGCVGVSNGPVYWVDGMDLVVPSTLPGSTALDVCAVGDVTPCEYPEVKGLQVAPGVPLPTPAPADAATTFAQAWVTEAKYTLDDLAKRVFRFRVANDALTEGPGQLQASVFPFAKKGDPDPLSPPGLLATWDVACMNCEFTVVLSSLAPPKTPKKKTFLKKTVDVVTKPFTLAADGLGEAFDWLGGLVGIGGGGGDGKDVVVATSIPPQSTPPGQYVVEAPSLIPVPSTFYVRLVPLDAGGKPSGPPSNAVRLQQVDPLPPPKIESSPTPVPQPADYELQILSYHGILPPQFPNKICYIATHDAWPLDPFATKYTTDSSKAWPGSPGVKKGDPICQPEPEEPDIFEAIISWAEDAVNWASTAWSDLKSLAVDVILKYTPLGLQCSALEGAGALPKGGCATAFNVALDATLVALGIPPDIPNFDQLVDQGIEYLAAEVAAQVAIPPGVVQAAVAEGGAYAGLALSVAEQKLREELQQEIEDNLADAALAIQVGYSKKVAWIPDGIPVRPDDYLQPAMTLRVTRKPGSSPGGSPGPGCVVSVTDGLKLPASVISSPAGPYANFIKNLPHPLSPLTIYNLFADEKGFGTDKALAIPPLDPGESYDVPMTFRPDYYHSGWSPNGLIATSDYISVWYYLHNFGQLHLSASGCGSDTLDVPANAITVGAEIKP